MKNYRKHIYLWLLLPALYVTPYTGNAQKSAFKNDENYYTSYRKKTMVRLYLSQKFAPVTVSSGNTEDELNYKTNSKLNLGIGATYRSVTLNLSYGFSFLNKNKGQGNTKGLDFQFHLYPHKWAVDILGTFRKGFYLDPAANNGLNLSNFYQRPDIKRNIMGVSLFRVPNAAKFSYRAALIQNDWQTKSAGSLLLGGEVYYGTIKGDSAFVPQKVKAIFEQADITRVNFITFGPGIGYAYTLVMDKNFFLTGSLTAHLDANFSTEQKTGSEKNTVAIVPDFVYKGAIGYNSSSWSVSASVAGNALYVASAASSREYFLPTGALRFSIAKKIGN